MGPGGRGGGGSRWRRGVRCVTQLQQLWAAAGEVCTGGKHTPRGRAGGAPVTPAPRTARRWGERRRGDVNTAPPPSAAAAAASSSSAPPPLESPTLGLPPSLPPPSLLLRAAGLPPASLPLPSLPPSPSLPAVVVVIKVVVCVCVGHPAPPGAGGCWGRAGGGLRS